VRYDIAGGARGGGGGGVIFLQTPSRRCAVSVLAGAAGRELATNSSHGAGPSSVSSAPAVGASQILTSPFQSPGAPTLTQPVDGATGVSPRPRIQGTAEAGARVSIILDGALYASVEAGSDGAFSLDVSMDLSSGPHALSAFAEVLGVHSAASAPRSFDVVTPADGGVPTPGDGGVPDAGVAAGVDTGVDAGADAGVKAPGMFQVGCGCSASPGAGAGITALLLGTWATRRRQRV
jgi:MYXO-CTERM domain-containing protein